MIVAIYVRRAKESGARSRSRTGAPGSPTIVSSRHLDLAFIPDGAGRDELGKFAQILNPAFRRRSSLARARYVQLW